MDLLEKATKLASIAGLFSTNESIDEVATNDLQFMLLPALLGSLSLKLTSGDRKEIIDVAEIYFRDFLQRCNDYSLSDYVFKDKQNQQPAKPKTEQNLIKDMVNTRQNKIERFNEQKKLEGQLKDLKTNLANLNVDDEIKRKYFTTMILLFIHQAILEIDSIEMEKPILAHMQKMKEEEGNSSSYKKHHPKPKPLRPIILTKDDVQKAVYGAGYPSLPTMTVKEFYDKRVEEGIFPDPNKAKNTNLSLQQAALAGKSIDTEDDEIKEEMQVENDDPDYLEKMRNQDEYKDDHRRGWGNRMNRS